MRKINYTNKFRRQYKKLGQNLKKKVKETIVLLKNESFDNRLKVHILHWKLDGIYSCSVDYSIRIIFEINSIGDISLLLVWDHNIYKS